MRLTPADRIAKRAAIRAGLNKYRSDTTCRNGHETPLRSANSGSRIQCTHERGLERTQRLAAEREAEGVDIPAAWEAVETAESTVPVRISLAEMPAVQIHKRWQPGSIRPPSMDELRAGNARRAGMRVVNGVDVYGLSVATEQLRWFADNGFTIKEAARAIGHPHQRHMGWRDLVVPYARAYETVVCPACSTLPAIPVIHRGEYRPSGHIIAHVTGRMLEHA